MPQAIARAAPPAPNSATRRPSSELASLIAFMAPMQSVL
jgi:hypothetical protein